MAQGSRSKAEAKFDDNPQVQLIVVGAGGVGKSCLVMRYAQDNFANEIDPTLTDDVTCTKSIDGIHVDISVWEMSGQEDFAWMRPNWYPKVDGVIFCFNLSPQTDNFTSAQFEFDQLKTHRGPDRPLPAIIAVGTKSDLVDQTPALEELSEKARAILGQEVEIYSTSAKNNDSIDVAFGSIVRTVLSTRSNSSRRKCIVQ